MDEIRIAESIIKELDSLPGVEVTYNAGSTTRSRAFRGVYVVTCPTGTSLAGAIPAYLNSRFRCEKRGQVEGIEPRDTHDLRRF